MTLVSLLEGIYFSMLQANDAKLVLMSQSKMFLNLF